MSQDFITLKQLHQFDNLELMARQVVEGFIIGLHKSPFHGFSQEFAEHRLYNVGDPIKNIDWKVFGRTDRLYIKRYEEETNLRCQIILDVSSSMYFPYEEREGERVAGNKIRFSICATAALMHMLKKQRDAVGISMFANEVEDHTKARSTTVHHNLILAKLQALLQRDDLDKTTAATQSLHEITENIHKRSLVIIFSDMLDSGGDNEALFGALQHLKHNKHEVVLFHVVDQAKEIDFEFENRPYLFVDMETGEKVKLNSNQVKDYYQEKMKSFKSDIALKCAQYQIDFVEADINKDFSQVLIPYMQKRARMRV